MIAGKTWREIRVMTWVYVLLLELELVLAILLWPSLRNESLKPLKGLVPLEAFGEIVDAISDPERGYPAYMATQMFFKGVNIVGLAAAILLGTGIVARERENRTLEFLLARPVSRSRVLAAKFAVIAVAIVVPIFLTSWTAVPLSWVIEHDLSFGCVTLASAYNALFCVAFLCLTAAVSVRARTQVHVAFVIGVVIIVNVGIYFINEVRDASVFRLSDFNVYGPIMAGNLRASQVFWGKAVWLLLASGVLYWLADRLFRRSDL